MRSANHRPDDPLARMDERGPDKVVCISRRKAALRGVLVVDNIVRGKGGTRRSPTVTVSEVARLDRANTASCLIRSGGRATPLTRQRAASPRLAFETH